MGFANRPIMVFSLAIAGALWCFHMVLGLDFISVEMHIIALVLMVITSIFAVLGAIDFNTVTPRMKKSLIRISVNFAVVVVAVLWTILSGEVSWLQTIL